MRLFYFAGQPRLWLVVTLVAAGCFVLNAAPQRKGARNARTQKIVRLAPVDTSAILDSAVIFADDYVTAVIDKPEVKDARLKAMRNFYNRQSLTLQDSISGRVFNLAIQCLEQDKLERSAAFRQCFMNIARDTDPKLGPLFNMELADAVMRFDTTAVNRYADLLDAYAQRMDFNYDYELAEARRYVQKVRTRPPLREALVGVWVSEDIAGFPGALNNHIIYSQYHDGKDFEKEYMLSTMPVLKIRNSAHDIYKPLQIASLDSVTRATNERGLDFIKSSNVLHSSPGCRYYRPIEAWELPGYGYEALPQNVLDSASVDAMSPVNYPEEKRHSIGYKLFEDEYTAYAVWGDERLKRPNAEIAAIARQSVQQMQAAVAGQLSRSNYDFGTRLAGNLAASVGAALVGGIIDALMVSKEKIWSIEITLVPVSPYEMEAVTMAHLVIARSDTPKPEVYDYVHKTKYYKWLPDDDVFFNGMWVTFYDEPDGKPLGLHQVSKKEHKRRSEIIKAASKEFKEKKKAKLKSLKDAYNNTPKDNTVARAVAKDALDNYKQNPHRFYSYFNSRMLSKLKERAEKYKQDNP